MKSWTVWTWGLAILLTLPLAAGAQGVTEEEGWDRRGNDYNSFRARNLSECKRSCAGESRCRAYTFDTRNSECFLKDRVNKAQRNGVMVTGVKEDKPYPDGGGRGRLTEEEGQDRKGNDYTSFRARDLTDCKRECREDSRCQAYTFLRSSRECFLKTRVNNPQRSNDAVTGYKTDRPYPDGDGGGRRLTEETGQDRRGDDYDSFRVRDLSDCQRECRQDDRCRAYTYIRSSRECFVKSRVNSAQRNGDAVTGYKTDGFESGGGAGGRLTEEAGLDRKGNDYTSFRVRDLSDCQRECRQDDRCQAYTFISGNRECFLKDRINSAQRNGGAVTGYKQRD